MLQITFKERILKYIVHIGLSFIVPFLFVIMTIEITGNREKGMVVGIAIAFLTLNFFFAFYFLRNSLFTNIICGIIVTIISIGLTYCVMLLEIKPSFDFYGIYTGVFCYGFSSILSWELLYRFLKRKNNAT